MGTAIGLAGCSSSPPGTVTESGTTLWVADDDSRTGEAHLAGTLRYLPEDGCWVVEPSLESLDPGVEPEDLRTAIIWPQGTEVSDGSVPGVSVEGKTVQDGEGIEAGAGLVSTASEFDIPQSCRTGGIAFVRDVRLTN
ncbi:hypothetical protein SAMN05445756_0091 [Kytococcus aerolatus]|uniref:Uncharacterized protein n=2 Tax=Kytococcus TaxID=57499 RepID=A0A212T1A1_9MICO|nr:hypothetical protein Ksed_13280 [Kytococcus sedentarius DSM 20547]SNC59554.1 hypothetical protein SAMN05445756_0091 [Kytococcus aerolatus]STX12222.1 Uncharacterised protein [Kytococcus sedentarius]